MLGNDGKVPFHPVRALLGVTSLVMMALAVVYNELILAALDPAPPLGAITVATVRRVQLVFALVGVGALGLSLLVRRVAWLWAVTQRDAVAKGLLLTLAVVAPLAVLEVSLEPWTTPAATTTLFVKDSLLGWKHRPGVRTRWEGAPVRINRKGLRGPELPYLKPRGTTRVLYLGDSVTFGDKLAAYAETFGYRAGDYLEQLIGRPVETVNAGVSGYSPWQEYEYLRTEGMRYEPDVIVVAFVLNDVTEQFELKRFGGSWEGWQLWYTRSPLRQWFTERNIWGFAQRVLVRARFGANVPGGARERERLNVESLVEDPDREDVRRAWGQTLADLDRIVALARDQKVPVLLVGFPFAFQLTDGRGTPAPQAMLAAFARDRGLPYLDLLPVLRERLTAEGLRTDQLFADTNHLTALGCAIVGEIIAAALAPLTPPVQQTGARG